MKIQLWSEGYGATGGSSRATFHGDFDCDTLQEAARIYRDSLGDQYSRDCINLDRMTNWDADFLITKLMLEKILDK